MGDWTILIQGVGAHHNTDYPTDADKMAKEFVNKLKEHHSVLKAEFLTAYPENLLNK